MFRRAQQERNDQPDSGNTEEQIGKVPEPNDQERPVRKAIEIPEAEEPGIATQVPIQKINVSADEDDCGNEKPARKKEPEWQRPGKILERKAFTQGRNEDVDSGDTSAHLRNAALGTS